MADLARGQLRRKRADLILALDGRLEEHPRFLLAMQLRRFEAIEADIATLDQRIDERLEPHRAPHALLMQIPGVDWVVAAARIAEIGVDIERVRERLSFVGLGRRLPGQSPERRQAEERPGAEGRHSPPHDPGQRRDLGLARISASRVKGGCLKDERHRLKARRGALRAALAIAHKILVSAYPMLARNLPDRDLGEAYLDHSPEPSQTSNDASNASAIASP